VKIQMKQQCLFLLIVFLFLLVGCDALTPSTPLPEGETIAEIQGASHISPYANRPVYNVYGIVTVIKADGFYMQSDTPDEDPATSEGIYVHKSFVPGVSIGDGVLVNAMVEEVSGSGTGSLTITQLENPHIEIVSSGNKVPDPTIIGQDGRVPPNTSIDDDTNGVVGEDTVFDPENDGIDFYESLEGMLVQVNNAVVAGATNQYKEIVILADNGEGASILSSRGGLVIQEGDFNPERIILDDGLRQMPFVQTGDYSVEPIIGVMDYTYGNYKLQPTASVSFESGGLEPETVVSPSQEGQIRIASYNVLNLSAKETERIEVLADQIVSRMASPEIIGLQEVQDNDGSTSTIAISADETYQAIIEAIQNLGGPLYNFVDIDPAPNRDGGIPGGNIRVGFLYRADRGFSLADAPDGDAETAVTILTQDGMPALSLNPGRIDPTNAAFADSRKPLVVEFNYHDKTLFLINNHFNSKSGDAALFGELQPPIFESEIQRIEQAQVVHDFVAEILAVDPDANVIVMGDLNDFQFSNPINTLEGDLLLNLIETLPAEERYTYVYDGNSQVLDHILISESLLEHLVSMDILHINSEFDYQNRFSDHDALIATFTLE